MNAHKVLSLEKKKKVLHLVVVLKQAEDSCIVCSCSRIQDILHSKITAVKS